MLKRRTLIQGSLAAALVLGFAGFSEAAKWWRDWRRDNTGWRPMTWPFPRDGWADGRAWRGEDGMEVARNRIP